MEIIKKVLNLLENFFKNLFDNILIFLKVKKLSDNEIINKSDKLSVINKDIYNNSSFNGNEEEDLFLFI
jgi:hypothetical protein